MSQAPDRPARVVFLDRDTISPETVLRPLSFPHELEVFDRTTAVVGAAMGNASSHNCKNLPILVAGGGFKHGRHIAFDPVNNTPLCRLYVSILQRFGIEDEQFATGKSVLPGLEPA